MIKRPSAKSRAAEKPTDSERISPSSDRFRNIFAYDPVDSSFNSFKTSHTSCLLLDRLSQYRLFDSSVNSPIYFQHHRDSTGSEGNAYERMDWWYCCLQLMISLFQMCSSSISFILLYANQNSGV